MRQDKNGRNWTKRYQQDQQLQKKAADNKATAGGAKQQQQLQQMEQYSQQQQTAKTEVNTQKRTSLRAVRRLRQNRNSDDKPHR